MAQVLLEVPDVILSLQDNLKTLRDDKIFQSIFQSQPPMAYTPAQVHTVYTQLGTLELELIRTQSSLLEAGRNYRESIELLPKVLNKQQSGFFDDLAIQMTSGYQTVKRDLEQTFATLEQQIVVIELKRNILLYALYQSEGKQMSLMTRFDTNFKLVREALKRRNDLNEQIAARFSVSAAASSVLPATTSVALPKTLPNGYHQCSLCSSFYKQCGLCAITDEKSPMYNQCGFCRQKTDSSYKQCGFCPLAAQKKEEEKSTLTPSVYSQHRVKYITNDKKDK